MFSEPAELTIELEITGTITRADGTVVELGVLCSTSDEKDE